MGRKGFLGLLAVLVLAEGGGGSTIQALEVSAQPDLERGKVIYQTHCLECHGTGGKGDGPRAVLLAPRPGNLVSAATSSKTNEELLDIIRHGVPRTAMQGWDLELSDDDQQNVLAYVRSLVHFQEPSLTPAPP